MEAISEMYRQYGTIDVNKVWQAREAEQAARNQANFAKNLPRGHEDVQARRGQ